MNPERTTRIPSPRAVALPVVVAVAPDGSDAALREGAATAVRAGAPLHVLHVVDLTSGGDQPGRPDQFGRPRDVARAGVDVLWDGVVRARSLVGDGAHVTSELAHGPVLDSIVAAGRTAGVLVLQRSARPRRAARGTEVCPRVVARADVPVVCVPAAWNGARGAALVTVGIDDPLTCGSLLRQALVAAASRSAQLRVVHVTWGGCEDAHRMLRLALAELSTELPNIVETTVEVVSGDAAAVLREAAHSSELLVVGRHHPHHRDGLRLGAVARALVRHAACPVLLPTPSQSVSSGEWVFETQMA